RGNGSARAETSVKAAARPSTIRIRVRRGLLRDTLDDDVSTITIPVFRLHRLSLGAMLSLGSGCAAQQAFSRLLGAEGVRNMKPTLADSNFGPVCTSLATRPRPRMQ